MRTVSVIDQGLVLLRLGRALWPQNLLVSEVSSAVLALLAPSLEGELLELLNFLR